MEVKISVIIAMYNAERYICDCVRNVLAQSLSDIEVIVVNDCSTDESVELIRKAFGSDERVVIIDQPQNMGPGEARNVGIKAARGKYITFLDSDDAIMPDALEKLFLKAQQYSADVVHGTRLMVPVVSDAPSSLLDLTFDDTYEITFEQGSPQTSERLLSGDISLRIESWLLHEIHWSVWNKLYSTEFIRKNNIHFAKMKMAEDQVFCFSCLINAVNYLILPGAFYMYRLDAQSLSRGKYNSRFAYKILEAMFDCFLAVKGAVEGNEFIGEKPEYADRVYRYILNGLDNGFFKT